MTDTPTAPLAQQKTIEEKIAEARELERKLWAATKAAEDVMAPFKQAYNKACREWCDASDRLKMLEALKKEMGV